MGRPTKINVVKKQDGYEITCIDEITGSATGMDIPIEGYEALKHHFKTGAMEISSDEISNCTIPTNKSMTFNFTDFKKNIMKDEIKRLKIENKLRSFLTINDDGNYETYTNPHFIAGELVKLFDIDCVSGSCLKQKHRRHITEKELKIAANKLKLQYGLITHIISKVREMQGNSDNYR